MKQSDYVRKLPKKIGVLSLSTLLCLSVAAGPGALQAYGDPLGEQTQETAAQAGPTLSGITRLGTSLSTTNITDNGAGDFAVTIQTDAASVTLSPRYQLSGLTDDAKPSVKMTCGKSVKRSALASYKDGSYGQASGVTRLSHPGKSRDVVTYELFAQGKRFGSLTVQFIPYTNVADAVVPKEPAAPTPDNATTHEAPSRLAAPQNVRIEDGFLAWDAVEGAQRYEIIAYRYTDSGELDKKWRVNSTSLENPRESLAEIGTFLELPSGNYRFAVRASILHNGYWNATRASAPSAQTVEPIAL